MHLPGFDIYLNHSTCEGSANSSEMDGSVPPNSGSSNPSAILLPICAALMIAANYVPLLLLLKVKKLAACTLVIVVAIENVFTFINAILWPNDNTAEWYSGAGLCDVQVAIRTPLTTLLASSTAYLSWDLAKALDTNNPRLYETRKSRRRRIAIELLFCFAVPALQVPLQYVILMNRFSIATIYGCSGYWDNSWPSLVILAIWPPIFALVNCCFAVLVIVRLHKHRGMLSSTLSSTGSGLNARRFIKLFFLSSCILVVYFPVILFYFYEDVNFQYHAYSWSRVHDPAVWSQIVYVTTDLSPLPQYNGWLEIVMAGFLVILYGLSNEGREIYKRGLVSCGLGKMFPRLLELREVPTQRRNSLSRGSLASRFDVVTRVIHYYDGADSAGREATSDLTSLRNGSGATVAHTRSSRGKLVSTSTIADLELATLSSPSSHPLMTSAWVVPRPTPPNESHLLRPSFRTHPNLPHTLLTANSFATLTTSDHVEHQGRIHHDNASLSRAGSVETSIWSNTDPDGVLEPRVPRMGTRAYRERQRRIHEQRDVHLGVIPDTVTVDLGTSGPSKQEIKFEKMLEIVEEVAQRPSI